jgi:hypothetical protein
VSKDRTRPDTAGSPDLDGLQAFCLFAGPNRSGSSLVGSMLDAHPDALIAHELDLFAERGYSGELEYSDRDALFAAIVQRSARAAEKGRRGRRRSGDVSYAVDGQGRSDRPLVIGTKRSYRTMTALALNPHGLDEVAALVGLPLRIVHCVRNPFDNVATMIRDDGRPDSRWVQRYRDVTAQVAGLKEAGWDIGDVHIEDVVTDPRSALTSLTAFLGLSAPAEYLEACAALASGSPSETRHGRDWQPEDVRSLQELIERTPWLARYAGSAIRA